MMSAGLFLSPLKMAGREMSIMVLFTIAIMTPRVVLDRATHL